MSDLRSRCWNWGRWGRQRGGPHNVTCSLGSLIGEKVTTTEGRDETEVAISYEVLVPVDALDAEELDGFILTMAKAHRDIVRTRFYLMRNSMFISRHLAAALRHLQDRIDGDRWRGRA